MKHLKNFFIAVCIGIMCAACGNDDEHLNPAAGKLINFSASVAQLNPISTKASSNDVNITNGTVLSGMQISVSDLTNNKIIETTNGTTWGYTGPEGLYFPLDGSNIKIYAVCPTVANMSSFISGGFTIQEDQSDYTNYNKSDLMSCILTQEPTTDKVNLAMVHNCAKILIHFNNGISLSTFTAKLKDIETKGSITEGANSLVLTASTGNKKDIIMGTCEKDLVAVIIPQKKEPGAPLFEVSNGTVTYGTNMGMNYTFEAGYVYKINLTFGETTIKAESVTISDWKNSKDGTRYEWPETLITK